MGQEPAGGAANPWPPVSIPCEVGEVVTPHGSRCSLRACNSWAGWNARSDHSTRATAAPVGWGFGWAPSTAGHGVLGERVFGDGHAEGEHLAAGSVCIMQGW